MTARAKSTARRRQPAPPPEPVELSIRMDRELHAAITAAAQQDDRTVASWVRQTLRAALEADSRPPAGGEE